MSQLSKWSAYLLIWAGSGLVVVSAVVHFHLWDSDGYNRIPTIGPLFLMQAIVGVLLALATSIWRHWLLAAAEAGFALATLGGFLISVNFGLFGWQDTYSAPFASLTLYVEVAATAALIGADALLLWPWARQRRRPRRP